MATTWAPKMPVTPGGDSGKESGLAGKIRPLMTPTFTASAGAGYKMRRPVRAAAPGGAVGCRGMGPAPLEGPGAGAGGGILGAPVDGGAETRKRPRHGGGADS